MGQGGTSWRRVRVFSLAFCLGLVCVWVYWQGMPSTGRVSDEETSTANLQSLPIHDSLHGKGLTVHTQLSLLEEVKAGGGDPALNDDAELLQAQNKEAPARVIQGQAPGEQPVQGNDSQEKITALPTSLVAPNEHEDAGEAKTADEQQKHAELMHEIEEELKAEIRKQDEQQEQAHKPLLVWWHSVLPGDEAEPVTRQCAYGSCTVAIRSQLTNTSDSAVAAYLFYGPNFVANDLPLPRTPTRPPTAPTAASPAPAPPLWALFAEDPEAARVLSYPALISLFNLTSTFSHNSHRPLTLQHMLSPGALSKVPIETFADKSAAGRAEILLLSTRCGETTAPVAAAQEEKKEETAGTAEAREALADWEKEAEEEHEEDRLARGAAEAGLKIDRISLCNESLFQDPKAIIGLVARYKFTVVRDDAACPDYIDQPLFLTLMAGSVPLYFGHPSVREWFPSRHMIVLPTDFSTPEAMWQQVAAASANESLYLAYHAFRALGPDGWVSERLAAVYDQESHVSWLDMMEAQDQASAPLDEFECFVCDSALRPDSKLSVVDESHLFCPCTGDPDECAANAAVAAAVARAVSAGSFSDPDRTIVDADSLF